jgi:hypothetical protein
MEILGSAVKIETRNTWKRPWRAVLFPGESAPGNEVDLGFHAGHYGPDLGVARQSLITSWELSE